MWVPPEDPFIEDGPVIHVKESVEVKLECVARGGKPPAKVSDIFQMINGTDETIFGYFQILCTMHSVAKVPFFQTIARSLLFRSAARARALAQN